MGKKRLNLRRDNGSKEGLANESWGKRIGTTKNARG